MKHAHARPLSKAAIAAFAIVALCVAAVIVGCAASALGAEEAQPAQQSAESDAPDSASEMPADVQAGRQKIIDESLSEVKLGDMGLYVPNQIELTDASEEGGEPCVYGQVNNLMLSFSRDTQDVALGDDEHEYSFHNLNDDYLADYLDAMAADMGGTVLDARVTDIGQWTWLIAATWDESTQWIDYLYYTVIDDCGYAISATKPGQELSAIELDALNLIAASLHQTEEGGERS